jgi:FkbM family methyltransferase
MKVVKKFRRRVADFFRSHPELYDAVRQMRLRFFGPVSEIGKLLDAHSKGCSGEFSFLQIGANDGLRNDPLRDFIVRDRWSGVFVEPLPDVFPLLEKNYAYLSGERRLEFVNAAVSSTSASLPFFTFREPFLAGKPLEERLHLLRKASFDRNLVLRFSDGAENIAAIEVPCFGINELLARHFSDRRLSLLALDVEGHELEILREADFSSFHIGAVLFETWNLGDRREEVFSVLRRNGYAIAEAEGDALATRTGK